MDSIPSPTEWLEEIDTNLKGNAQCWADSNSLVRHFLLEDYTP
jgi:hypothetical protein